MATMTILQSPITSWERKRPDSDTLNQNPSTETYPQNVDDIRMREYPALKSKATSTLKAHQLTNMLDSIYLDHAGTTLYAKSLIESFSAELTGNVFGNPHSASPSSEESARRIEDARLNVLNFLNADPEQFSVVFVANATAALKLVADAFRDCESGFWYSYHGESHTSMIGIRELASLGNRCFSDDATAQEWISSFGNESGHEGRLTLFAYPGQSNMTGRRLPLDWCRQLRNRSNLTGIRVYSLFDAASLASTSPLNLGDVDIAPDFTALSFYKIFGFPDLGALIVRNASGDVLRRQKYFAGGTVDSVSACSSSSWHMKKESLHHALENGTSPFHSIIALNHALKTHTRIFGSMRAIATHTGALCDRVYNRMCSLRHANGRQACKIYGRSLLADQVHGPVLAFNILDSHGNYVSNTEVEKLAVVRNIHLRTGGLCNPGGVATHLDLKTDDLKHNYASGLRCGGENDIIDGKPTGVVRISLGPMSNSTDVDQFVAFLEEFFVDHGNTPSIRHAMTTVADVPRFHVDSMAVFPIKSCAAFKVPASVDWKISAKGLVYDREWCLLHQGTNVALSQKQHPKMALIQPSIDLETRLMTVSFLSKHDKRELVIELDDFPHTKASLASCRNLKTTQSMVCGEAVTVHLYTSTIINDFFSDVLGVSCALARYSNFENRPRTAKLRKPISTQFPNVPFGSTIPSMKLSNESPILLVSRSSVNRLNTQIRQHRHAAEDIAPDSFRANIVVSEYLSKTEAESPYAEDSWIGLRIGDGHFSVLGPCKRCQMVCVDQATATRRPEPFSTLAKTRRWDGGVWFGVHLCLDSSYHAVNTKADSQTRAGTDLWSGTMQTINIRVGDPVSPLVV